MQFSVPTWISTGIAKSALNITRVISVESENRAGPNGTIYNKFYERVQEKNPHLDTERSQEPLHKTLRYLPEMVGAYGLRIRPKIPAAVSCLKAEKNAVKDLKSSKNVDIVYSHKIHTRWIFPGNGFSSFESDPVNISSRRLYRSIEASSLKIKGQRDNGVSSFLNSKNGHKRFAKAK